MVTVAAASEPAEAAYSSVCTGGRREALACGAAFACGAGAAGGEAGPDWTAGLVSDVCTGARAARREVECERRKPQECAIDGPAV